MPDALMRPRGSVMATAKSEAEAWAAARAFAYGRPITQAQERQTDG